MRNKVPALPPAAEEEVLAGLEGRGEIPLEEYRELLLQSLDFINRLFHIM